MNEDIPPTPHGQCNWSLHFVFILQSELLEVLQNEEDTRQDDVTLPTVAQQDSLVHQSDQGHCQESVAVVHRADN